MPFPAGNAATKIATVAVTLCDAPLLVIQRAECSRNVGKREKLSCLIWNSDLLGNFPFCFDISSRTVFSEAEGVRRHGGNSFVVLVLSKSETSDSLSILFVGFAVRVLASLW